MIPRHASPRLRGLVLLAALVGGCVSVPKSEPVQFAVDDDVLRDPSFDAELERAAEALREDRDLHLRVVGHADEDNTEDYNRALSLRRAEHVRARILAHLDDVPAVGERVLVEARGEWDARERGSSEEAKARNRRVELRFYYPRQCEPSFDVGFVACEWQRLPPPGPPRDEAPAPEASDEPEQELARVETPPPSRARLRFRGAYLAGFGGYAIGSGEYIRQQGRWGVNAGYLFGFESDFRIALGLSFDHLVDAGFLFPQQDACAPFCSELERSRVRIGPELRLGGARRGIWGWLRVSGGLLLQHREAQLDEDSMGEILTLSSARWFPGPFVGIGPGVAIALTGHLFLMLDATVSLARVPRAIGGLAIFDASLGLGWVFGASESAAKPRSRPKTGAQGGSGQP